MKAHNHRADTTALERDPPKRLRTRIDRLVYELYELTPEEIAIVEGENKVREHGEGDEEEGKQVQEKRI